MLTSALLVALVMYIAKFCDHALGQPLIERPLVCGAMVGLVLGDFQQGIIIGASLELIFLGTITIGGSVPADLAVGSVLATAFTLLTKAEPAVAVALALPISLLAVFVYQVLKLVYTALVEKYDALLEEGRDRAALGLVTGMILFYGIPFAVIAFFGVLFGTDVIRSLVDSIPHTVMRGMTVVGGILPALGFAILLKALWNRAIAAFFFIGFALSAYLHLPIMGIAIIAASVAVYLCFSEFNQLKFYKRNASVADSVSIDDKDGFFND
ncbi:PTS mannose/fructose/sorbose/N-acetylgalactosamine transporter subunit IIC [Martelella alba]|uniref:PTS sugar transporter subunit IIC n=1 Tax=Martelella alba TaxID=2590451 RepID=A0ABY2SP34_9HYPH|nr:PTS sugar transporter subunit IIC [Martelella alba]TKI07661.1 PTS sugar transporter subunit IIC [Martelella alba]